MSTSPAAAAAYAKFVQFVAPLTRFDAASLPLISGTTEMVQVVARQTDSVAYDVSYQDGAGAVPAGVQSRNDAGALKTFLDDCRRREQAQLAGRLNHWLARDGRTIGRRLSVPDCFDGPHAGGYATACESCKGKGKVDCSHCRGDGRTKCPDCNNGMSRSLVLGYRDCSLCHGRGQVNHTGLAGKEVPCSQCHGQGTVPCTTCHLTTAGFVPCQTCAGKKQVDCTPCNATGWKHRIGTLVCKVTDALAVRAGADGDEPRSTIESLKTLGELHALAPLHLQDAALDGNAVRRDFAGAMPVTTLRLRAVRSEFELVAYGEHGEIRDFKNVLGTLLDADVNGLQDALRATPFLPLRPCGPLNAALGHCLRSDLLAQAATTAPSGHEALVAGPLKNAVSVAFVAHIAQVARRAVARSFRAHIAVPALIVALVPTLAFFATVLMGVSRGNRLPIAIGAAVAAGVLAELWARRRWRSQFEADMRGAVGKLLHMARSLWWWRAGMLVAALLVFMGVFAVVATAGIAMR